MIVHGYALTALCFDTLHVRSCALRLGGALEWPTRGLTRSKGQKGNIMRTLIPVGHLWKQACLQMTAEQYCAAFCSFKKKALVRCSSSSSSASSRQRNQHNPTSVRGGKILRKDPCPSLQQFPPSPRRACFRERPPPVAPVLAVTHSGSQLWTTQERTGRDGGWWMKLGCCFFFFFAAEFPPGCQVEMDSRTNGDQI